LYYRNVNLFLVGAAGAKGNRQMVVVASSKQWPWGKSKGEEAQGAFSDSVGRLLARIDYRRADSAEEREAIFRLRYDAYLREGAISGNPSGTFLDRYDDRPNAYLFGLYIDGKLASSIRIHVASKEQPSSLSLEAFPDILRPELDAGKIIIDPNRFVADPSLSRTHRGLPYATLRLSMMAAQHFNADLVLAAVRVEHQAFYRRAFNQQVICEPRPYPNLNKPLCLMAIHYPSAVNELWRRYPFIPATASERRRLFERPQGEATLQPAVSSEHPGADGTRSPFVEDDIASLAG
jgi:N-acyl-L-homoserine lactone synthetase